MPLPERMTRWLKGRLKEAVWKVALEPEDRTHTVTKPSRFIPVNGCGFKMEHVEGRSPSEAAE